MAKNETSVTFYGGVNEIGGNKILVKDRDTSMFLDFGMSFAMNKQYYSPPFLQPRSEKSLRELGILPKLKGVYRFEDGEPEIDAVLVSHGHLDHASYLSFIKREIPVLCGETTQIILESHGEIRRADLEFDVDGLQFKPFRTGRKLVVGDLEVEPVHVDHSVPGAYGFIIHAPGGAIVYTGDFRLHGAKGEMTSDFVARAKKADPAVVITEATNLTGASVSSETEVENKLNDIVNQTSGIVLAGFAHADVDRLKSFHRVAEKSGRCLALSLKQAHLLERLGKDPGLSLPNLENKNILVFRKSKKRYEKWENELIEHCGNRVIDVFEVSKQQCKVILALSFYDLEELVEMQPQAGSCYVSSISEPFNEEMEIDYERLLNWLSHYGLPHYHAHVSGHIMPLQLKNVLEEIGAKKTFPIHTEHATLFARFMRDTKTEVVLPEKGKTYKI